MLKARNSCPICGARSLKPLISIPDVPSFCNRLCASEVEAADVPRGDISLAYCAECGHVINAGFDSGRVNYDERFENTLTLSPQFRRYAEATADRLIDRFGLIGKRIVEIGCGSGDFLRLLCCPGNYGEGYDPSQPSSRCAAGAGTLEIVDKNFAA